MTASRIRDTANALAALSGLLVVVLHVYAGVRSRGHLVWRPVGEPTIFVLVGWMVSIALCVPVLIMTRGRSPAAIGALAVTLASAVLVLVV